MSLYLLVHDDGGSLGRHVEIICPGFELKVLCDFGSGGEDDVANGLASFLPTSPMEETTLLTDPMG
jgi:hypothetical protein